MKLTANTKILKLVEEYPFLIEYLANYHPKFAMFRSEVMRQTFARFASLRKVASMGEMDLAKLLTDIADEIERQTGQRPEVDAPSEVMAEDEKLRKMKDLLKKLHSGEKFETVKAQFDKLLSQVDADEIVEIEQRLIVEEGVDPVEIQKLCDVHVDLFRQSLDEEIAEYDLPEGHPVLAYVEENKKILDWADLLNRLLRNTAKVPIAFVEGKVRELLDSLMLIDIHYARKENSLFPFMEKHGMSGPPQVMWGIHDEVRKGLKEARRALDEGRVNDFQELATKTVKDIIEMVFKEHSILFPMALADFFEDEWKEVKRSDDEIGYMNANQPREKIAEERQKAVASGDVIQFATGILTPEQIEMIFSNLPVDVSYVDENDVLKFYNNTSHRIFPRAPSLIGRKVQNCHPPKSVHVVEKILEAFKSGEKDVAEFWLQTKGKFIHIRYFAVRDHEGRYRGVLEMMQDVTDIRALEGERRLLQWDDE